MRKLLYVWILSCITAFGAEKKIVLLAGSPSHGAGEHEFNAGCQLLKKCLNEIPGVQSEVYNNGWPTDERVFDGAAAIFLYSDGGDGHPFNRAERREVIGRLMD